MEKIVLVGGGGHCKSCIDVIETEQRFDISGIIDVQEKLRTSILGYDVIGTDNDYPRLTEKYHYFLITLGQLRSPERREVLYQTLAKLGVSFPVIISPHAYISKTAKIGPGTIIMHGAIINADATIGENCIINSHALVEHDAHIESHCHISTAAVINGGVTVGSGSFVGSGAVTKQYSTIPPNSFIKAHSLFQ